MIRLDVVTAGFRVWTPGTGSFLPAACLPRWTVPRMRTD
jgi:hypothetical protein